MKPAYPAVWMCALLAMGTAACESGGAPGVSPDSGAPDAGPAADAGGEAAPGSSFLTIDDMEARSDLPAFPPGSAGFWWPLGGGLGNWFFSAVGDDGARINADALPEAIVPPRGDSLRGRHLKQPPGGMGADLYAQLKHPSNGAVDLSPYLGISFWARMNSAGGRLIVALQGNPSGALLTTASADAGFAQVVSVSDRWQRFILLFDDFHRGAVSGTGDGGEPFTPEAVALIDFVAGLDGEAVDLWIDDLALLCRGTCAVPSL